jgi:hypothetical protein
VRRDSRYRIVAIVGLAAALLAVLAAIALSRSVIDAEYERVDALLAS